MNEGTESAPTEPAAKRSLWLRWPVLLALLALLAVIGVAVAKAHSAHENALSMARSLFDYATYQIVDASGCSIWLARATVLLAIIPLWYFSLRILARPKSYLPWRRNDPAVKRARDRALIVFAVYCALFFFVMYGATRNTNFSHQSNEVRKWVNERTGQTFDSPGRDPKTGETLIPMTTELAIQMERWAKNTAPRLLTVTFIESGPPVQMFDPVTGKPQVWFSRGDQDTLRFFDAEGYDPATNEKLQPVTREILAEARTVFQSLQAQAEAKHIDDETRNRETALEEAKTANCRRYYVSGSAPVVNRKLDAIIMVTGADSAAARQVEDFLAKTAEAAGLLVRANVLTKSFDDDGLLDAVLSGHFDRTRDLALSDLSRTLWIGQLEQRTNTQENHQNLTTCDGRLVLRSIDLTSGEEIGRSTIETTGTAFSRESAGTQFLTKLQEQMESVPKALNKQGVK